MDAIRSLKLRALVPAVAIGLFVGAVQPASATPAPDKSDNITLVEELSFGWVSEIAFQGRWAYVYGESLWIVDRFTKRVVGTFSCPGAGHYPGEVEVVKRGLVAIDKTSGCGAPETAVLFIDVRNPRKPILRSAINVAGNHTLTAYPGKPFIYVSPNGSSGDTKGGIERIIDVRDPSHPSVTEYVSNGLGCHDVGFVIRDDVKLAACAGGSETQIWDVSDPLEPVTLSRIPTPYVVFNHSAGFSDDAQVLVVGDENHVGTSCEGTAPTGALWFYDVSDPTFPILEGTHSNSHGSTLSNFWATFDSWCVAHMYDFKTDSRLLATGWYQGGLDIVNLDDPSAPKEVAFYVSEDFFPWAAYWVGDEIWTSDLEGWCSPSVVGCSPGEGGGVEIFKLDM